MPGPLAEWLDEWALVLPSTNLSSNTAETYLKESRRFLAWHGGHRDETTVDSDVIRAYEIWNKHELKLADSTRRQRLFCLLAFFRYIAAQPDSAIDTNPTDGVEFPIVKKQPPQVIPDDELVKLLATCRGNSFVDRRDTLIIRLLNDCGIRRGELSGVDVDGVDRGHQLITVLGKGEKLRTVPFGAKSALALTKYLRMRAQRPLGKEKALLVGTRTRPDGSWRLTGAGIWEMVNRRARQAGLGMKVWPHLFRHTWAGDLLDAGANEQDVERMGGWAPGSPMVKWYGSANADARARNRVAELARGDRV